MPSWRSRFKEKKALPSFIEHPITEQSFAVIDRELAARGVSLAMYPPAVYAMVRRLIHTTADFEYAELLRLSEDAMAQAQTAFHQGRPVITDVGMVTQGIQRVLESTFALPLVTALHQTPQPLPGKTRTETGLLACCEQYPNAVYVIGNAPTALLALCEQIHLGRVTPALVIGAPVGFINVLEAKQALAACAVPQIRITGRKGGSGVAAAITNALLIESWRAAEPAAGRSGPRSDGDNGE